MNISSRISRWQLATIGVVCCIVGTRILLSVGSREPLQEAPEPLQTPLPIEELLGDFPPLDSQTSQMAPESMNNPVALPSL